jgi:DNA-binding beta-propeller fold protein YncE
VVRTAPRQVAIRGEELNSPAPARDLTGAIKADVVVPGRPYRAAYSQDGRVLFVSLMPSRPGHAETFRGGQLAVIDTTDGRLVKLVDCDGARGIATSPDGRTACVARTFGAITTVDVDELAARSRATATSATTFRTLAGGSTGYVVYVNAHCIAASEELGNCISFVDTTRGADQVPMRIATGSGPVGLAVSANGSLLFAADQAGPPGGDGHRPGGITVIDLSEVSGSSRSGAAIVVRVEIGNCVRLAASADGRLIWATLRHEEKLVALDIESLVAGRADYVVRVELGPAPVGLALAEDFGVAVVANSNRFHEPWTAGQTLSVIDVESALRGAPCLRGSISVGAFPRELTSHARQIALTNFGSGTVALLDPRELI